MAEALRLIRAGDADVVVCGGAESPLGPTGIAGFANARGGEIDEVILVLSTPRLTV